jgi:MFS family permease
MKNQPGNLNHALRISTQEGIWATLHMVLTTGAFLTGFALMLGANDLHLAIIAAIPMLAQVFQLPGAYLVERSGHRKRITGVGSVLGRTCWLPMALIPWLGARHGLVLFMALYAISSLLMSASGPAWVAWMSDLVPKRIRGRYFGTRNRILGIVTIAASLSAGFFLDAARDRGLEAAGYMVLQLVAVSGGLLAFLMILRQPEPGYAPEPLPSPAEYLLRPLKHQGFRPVLIFFLYWLLAVGVSAPYFTAHLIKNMQWSFGLIATAGITTSALSIVCHPIWGRMVDRYGHRPVLILTSLGILHLPLYYAFCPYTWHWPVYGNAVLAGVFWSGFNLALFNLLMSASPSQGRPGYVALFAALSGLVNFASSMLGGLLAHRLTEWQGLVFGVPFSNYQLLFLLSASLRVPGVALALRIHEPTAKSAVVLVRQAFIEIDRRIGFGRQFITLPAENLRARWRSGGKPPKM